MGVRFDCAASIFLCAEDNNILDFDDDNDGNEELGLSGVADSEQRCDFYGDSLINRFPLQSRRA